MTAASFWSLLAPAIEISENQMGKLAFIPVGEVRTQNSVLLTFPSSFSCRLRFWCFICSFFRLYDPEVGIHYNKIGAVRREFFRGRKKKAVMFLASRAKKWRSLSFFLGRKSVRTLSVYGPALNVDTSILFYVLSCVNAELTFISAISGECAGTNVQTEKYSRSSSKQKIKLNEESSSQR